MRYFVFALIYMSIGMGVATAYSERYHKDISNVDNDKFLLLSAFWPALIAADTYRATFPPIPEKE